MTEIFQIAGVVSMIIVAIGICVFLCQFVRMSIYKRNAEVYKNQRDELAKIAEDIAYMYRILTDKYKEWGYYDLKKLAKELVELDKLRKEKEGND